MLFGNIVCFFQCGKLEIVSINFVIINELVDCMGCIIVSLCVFVWCSDDVGQVSLVKVVDVVLLILYGCLEQDLLILYWYFDDVCLGIDQICLEQILVNLLVNVFDVMSGQVDCQFWLEGWCEEECYVLCVCDNGFGILLVVCVYLFEFFFIIKFGEYGLGFGLIFLVSLVIVVGGSFSVQYFESGGIVFELSLFLVFDFLIVSFV